MTSKHAAVLDELKRREPIFHRSEFSGSRALIEAMTADDFFEVGASGRRYSRAFVLDTLDARRENPIDDSNWKTSDFRCRELAAGVYLLTYTLLQGTRRTRRCSLWQHGAQGWKVLFHQGTIVQDAGEE